LVSNIVLVVGIVIVLENTGIHLAALAVFAGAVGVGVGLRSAKHREVISSAAW